MSQVADDIDHPEKGCPDPWLFLFTARRMQLDP